MSGRLVGRGRVAPRSGIVPAVLAGLLALAGCATYAAHNRSLRTDLETGSYATALETLAHDRDGHSALLTWLERGLFLHYAGRWAESNDAFAQAEQLAADLYTKSVSQRVLSLLTSDEAVDYRAEPFELAMVPYYRALNYIDLGDREGALVEARKASLLLRQYTEEDLGRLGELDPDRDKSADDLLGNAAFLHYFSGLLYEWDGEDNDAFIAYRNAANAWHAEAGRLHEQAPPWLGDDLARTAGRLGFTAELAEARQALPELFLADSTAAAAAAARVAARTGDGDVFVLLELGFAPVKEQREIDLPVLKTDRRDDRVRWARDLRGRRRSDYHYDEAELDYWLRVAVPELVDSPPAVTGARVSAGVAGGHAVAVTVDDIAGRAFAAFHAQEGAMWLRTIARALAKYGTKEQADKAGRVAGLLANLIGAATERADTRSWLTLPDRIAMARLRLPPGRYDLRVDLLDAAGARVRTDTIPQVTVRTGDLAIVSRRAF
ncbi:MAG: COG3014 family protein [Candidatus Krumholzibacteriia bacterium]